MKLAYMAHPLGPDGSSREQNIQNAGKWFGWLHDAFSNIAFTANWVLLSSNWPETPEYRKRGLAIDMVHVKHADMIFFVGGRMSAGMLEEQATARKSLLHEVDLTFLGYGSPSEFGWPAGSGYLTGMTRELDKALSEIK